MTDKHRDQQSSVQTAHDKSVQKYVVQRLLWHNTWNTQEQLEWADWWISVVFKPSQLWQLHLGEDEKGGGGKEWGRKRERQGERKRGEKEGRRDRERRRTERGWERDGERIGRDTERGGGGSGGVGGERVKQRQREKKRNFNKPSDHPTWAFFISFFTQYPCKRRRETADMIFQAGLIKSHLCTTHSPVYPPDTSAVLYTCSVPHYMHQLSNPYNQPDTPVTAHSQITASSIEILLY